jgi:hypothetical protein
MRLSTFCGLHRDTEHIERKKKDKSECGMWGHGKEREEWAAMRAIERKRKKKWERRMCDYGMDRKQKQRKEEGKKLKNWE